ncbi:hypothetical protein GALMADRAFT_221896 [Galerina marginata CBS 339.88]|uniref:Uncharacterized protein n=1 Tax=Galerina marginata (strain CBS 339.88) TaxID=685588 RepID=A0A067TI59_GALM3|nr:hypothetical protein GALMADRAFT_221896 [Galerina marginata CBS 339.88]
MRQRVKKNWEVLVVEKKDDQRRAFQFLHDRGILVRKLCCEDAIDFDDHWMKDAYEH